MCQRFLNNAYKPNSSWIYSLPNGLTRSNPRQFEVDITSIGRGLNFDEFPRHFRVLFFEVILMVEKSTSFPRTFFDVISMVKKSMLFPRTLFDVISIVEISTLFLLTFFDVIWMGKNSISFLVTCDFKQMTFARFSLNFSSRSHWYSPVPLKFESYNLHHCKKNCFSLVFLVFTEQLLYRIILGQLYCY